MSRIHDYVPKSGSLVISVLTANTERVTESGVILPKIDKRPVTIGHVVSVGEGVDVSVGDTVLFAPYAGFSLVSGGENYLQLDQHEVLGHFTADVEATDVVVT